MNDTLFFGTNSQRHRFLSQCAAEVFKGRTIRKVMWGVGKKKKKNSCKGKCQEKKFMQRRR